MTDVNARTEQGRRLAAARLQAGWSSARAAALANEWAESSYRAHEAGTRTIGQDDAERYAKRFRAAGVKVTAQEILFGLTGDKVSFAVAATERPEPNATIEASMVDLPRGGGPRDLPVLGAAVGGGEYDGDFRLNGEVAEYTARPVLLFGRKKAFAVNLENTSMVPLYKPKQRIYVDPDGKKPGIGEEVLLEMYPEEDGVPGRAYVKTLVSRSASAIVVSQYNPEKTLRFDAREVKQMLRVIPYEELIGL